jgi:hypothetical protein
MKKTRLFFVGMIAMAVLTFGFFGMALSHNSLAASSTTNRLSVAPDIATLSNNSSLPQAPSSGLGSDELPPANLMPGDGSVSAALPTPVPGETQVYFVPTDNDATATVLLLYNTDTVTHTVALRGFSYNGVLVYSLNINIRASSSLRLSSDSIVSAPPPSWATPAPVITNFTDFTYLASLSLPRGVKVEGYTVFNPGTGVVDPRTDQGAIPLRFSTDPATLFLPLAQKNP